jgi:galactonate dehydratase
MARGSNKAMRIASVEVLGVGAEHASQHTLVRLTTDSGITGLGQSACWGYPLGVAGVLGELSPLLIGADPFRIEHLWHLTYRARPFRGNLLSAAVSGTSRGRRSTYPSGSCSGAARATASACTS